MTGTPTTQQRRAKHAWETIAAARKQFPDKAAWEEFDRQVKRLGPRIVTAGLGPAIAFLADKTKQDSFLLQCLESWVLHKGEARSHQENLIASICKGDSDQLRRWTAESLEWIVWVKRFCGAEGSHE